MSNSLFWTRKINICSVRTIEGSTEFRVQTLWLQSNFQIVQSMSQSCQTEFFVAVAVQRFSEQIWMRFRSKRFLTRRFGPEQTKYVSKNPHGRGYSLWLKYNLKIVKSVTEN